MHVQHVESLMCIRECVQCFSVAIVLIRNPLPFPSDYLNSMHSTNESAIIIWPTVKYAYAVLHDDSVKLQSSKLTAANFRDQIKQYKRSNAPSPLQGFKE